MGLLQLWKLQIIDMRLEALQQMLGIYTKTAPESWQEA
jgi:hypothetical protein